ncbi:MAG: aminoglycoside phosphotransferase family protein [bacterium]|nr:aminoglycoside phosphotransferase family protein [bacterium]
MTPKTPPAEVAIDEGLVRRLLRAQHPDLEDRTLALVGEGWDNAMYRLGDDLVVRLPRREVAAKLVRHEQRALATLAPRLPIPIPTPVRRGVPGEAYPWAWSVIPWFDGEEAVSSPPPDGDAERFVEFLRALHAPAPPDAPENSVRGIPLVQRAEAVETWFAELRRETDVVTPTIEAAWADAVAAPIAEIDVWLHGDLHGRNVLIRDGRFAAIIDWGDVTSGDAACDLASIWMLFEDPAVRADALDRYGADEALRRRALGSAISFAAVLLAHGRRDAPLLARIGANTFRRVETDLA